MPERLVEVGGGARVCAEAIGDPADPALLLLGGSGWSKDYWEDEFVERLAAAGRFVLRYDYRDTGASTTYPPGEPGYTADDLLADALAVLDAFGIERAHLAGLSMGGGLSQRLATEHRERFASLTLMATTSIVPGGDDLPGPTPAVAAFFAGEGAEPDWSDREAAVERLVEGERVFAPAGDFDEDALRALAERVFDRSENLASLGNHGLIRDDGVRVRPLSELEGLPVLVIHGRQDGLFPPAHGEALAAEIPGARLLLLDGMGHWLPPRDEWDRVAGEIAALG